MPSRYTPSQDLPAREHLRFSGTDRDGGLEGLTDHPIRSSAGLRQALDRPDLARPDTILHLGQRLGNRATRSLLDSHRSTPPPSGPEGLSIQPQLEVAAPSPVSQGLSIQPQLEAAAPSPVSHGLSIQPQLEVAAPSHPSEDEADRVASLVTGPAGQPSKTPVGSSPAAPGSLNLDIHESASPGLHGSAVPRDVEQTITREKGGGQPLDAGLRASMESKIGADFGRVRVHTGETADQLNTALQSRAFTTGQDIFFRQDRYQPGQAEGQRLIAHELTHVVQQTGASTPGVSAAREVVQRELMTAEEFAAASKSSKMGSAGTTYKAIKALLAGYHQHKGDASQSDRLKTYRKLSALCLEWLRNHGQFDVDAKSGVASFTPEKGKSADRSDAMLLLKSQADEEFMKAASQSKALSYYSRPLINVFTGQGAMASLKSYRIGSNNFLSCSPVVMFNQQTKMGGLYHFSSGSLETQKVELINMAKTIQPSNIVIFRGKWSVEGYLDSFLKDEDDYALSVLHTELRREYEDDPDKIREIEKDPAQLREFVGKHGDQAILSSFLRFCEEDYHTHIENNAGTTDNLVISLDDKGKLSLTAPGRLDDEKHLLDMRDYKEDKALEDLAPDIMTLTSSVVDYTAGSLTEKGDF